VVHREAVRLKPKDPLRGFPPTEKEATVTNIDIYRLRDGRIVEQWNHPDRFGVMQQLGNFPTPGHGGG
jgi:predicted ester cyclase